jgi:hypothetical protein
MDGLPKMGHHETSNASTVEKKETTPVIATCAVEQTYNTPMNRTIWIMEEDKTSTIQLCSQSNPR